jgi:exosortase J
VTSTSSAAAPSGAEPKVMQREASLPFLNYGWRSLSSRTAIALACLCAAFGTFTVYSSARMLLSMWSTDDLKSMGLVVPFLSAALILRAWRHLGWETEGSWWGFAVLASTAVLVFVRDQTLLVITINKNWLLQLPPLPLIAILYAASMVVLFGGWRLLRTAWFPVLLMGAVIPVPNTFARRVDLPLQHASATVARAWAHALGQQLTQDKLRLMFTPDFGMFIAPGCNGIRGAVTLGLAALVVSYLYRFRWYVFAPVVAGAVLLGYLFNFLRLCLLVVYYKIALPYPWLQHHAKIADYVIGGCLFVCALSIFFAVANKLRRDLHDVSPATPDEPVHRPTHVRAYLYRVGAVLALSSIFAVDAERRIHAEHLNALDVTPPALPASIGPWQQVRTWNDTLLNGWIVYTWAEYALPGSTGPHVSLGVSPRLGVHDAEICHMARGEDPTWHGELAATTPSGPASLSAALYNNGVSQKLEASTVCQGEACNQYSGSGKHVTLVVAPPEGRLPMQTTLGPVPILLKLQTSNTTLPTAIAESQLAAQLNAFLHDTDLATIARPYGHRQ